MAAGTTRQALTAARQALGPAWLPRADDGPAHRQIEQRLAARIGSGELPDGSRLPGERALAEALGVSRMTVRQALASLAARGLITRGVGRGTFVCPPRLAHDLTRVAGFSEQVRRAGLEPGADVRAVARAAAPPPAVAAALALSPSERAIRIQRVRTGGGIPLALEDSWLPADRFPGLEALDLTGSIYALMRDAYGLGPVRATEALEPAVAAAAEASVLGVRRGAPLMRIERTAYAAADIPVEHARDLHRGEHARFLVDVPREVLSHA